MKTFDVYKHPQSGFQAVKQGFGWPAFFFTFIWAWVKGMWALGFLLLGALLFLQIIAGTMLAASGSEGVALLVLIAQISVYVFVGVKGNDWRRSYLTKRGFRHLSTVSAQSPEAAIGSATASGEPSLQGA